MPSSTEVSIASPEASPRQSRAPLWISIPITLVLGGLIFMLALNGFEKLSSYKVEPPRETPPPQVLRVEVFEVEPARLKRYVWGFGTAEPEQEVTVSAEVGGRVAEVQQLDVGRQVQGAEITIDEEGTSQRSPGQMLVHIDPETYEERVSQAQASIDQFAINLERLDQEHETNQRLLEQQQRRLNTVQQELERQNRLLDMGAGRQSEVDRVTLELEQYREQLIRLEETEQLYPIRRKELLSQQASAKNALRLAQIDLEKATIYPPFSGVLSEVFVEQGQYVRPGDPLVQITAVDRVEVAVPLSLSDASAVEQLLAGGHVPIAELAASEDEFVHTGGTLWRGEVRRLDPIADVQTRTVNAFVEVDNTQQGKPLRPGTFCYARIEAGQIEQAAGFLVPRDTLVNRRLYLARPNTQAIDGSVSTGDEHAEPVAASTWMEAELTEIQIARTFQTFVLVSAGLQPGDWVVMTNLDIIREGTLLDPRETHTLNDEFERLRAPYLERLE